MSGSSYMDEFLQQRSPKNDSVRADLVSSEHQISPVLEMEKADRERRRSRSDSLLDMEQWDSDMGDDNATLEDDESFFQIDEGTKSESQRAERLKEVKDEFMKVYGHFALNVNGGILKWLQSSIPL